jgi:hypothetical protein
MTKRIFYSPRDAEKRSEEAALTEIARNWLIANGVGLDRESCRAKAIELSKMPKPGPRDWARKVLQRFADGEHFPDLCIRNAREALEKLGDGE